MKSFLFLLIILFVHFCGSSSDPIRELRISDSNFDSLIPLIEVIQNHKYDDNKDIPVIRIKKVQDYYEIRAAVLYRDDFSWYLRGKTDMLFGYLKHNDKLILVFGEDAEHFFMFSDQMMSLKFLDIIPEAIKKDQPIPSPPIIFEPEVWIYHIKNNKLTLFEKGALSLLE